MSLCTTRICSSNTHLLVNPFPGIARPQPSLVHRYGRSAPLYTPCTSCSCRRRHSVVEKGRPASLQPLTLQVKESRCWATKPLRWAVSQC